MLYRHQARIGAQVFITGIDVTCRNYGSNSEMEQMIGKFYPVRDFATDGYGVVLKHHKCSSLFTFRFEDLSITPVVKKGPAKQIKVDTKLKTKFDETLLTI